MIFDYIDIEIDQINEMISKSILKKIKSDVIVSKHFIGDSNEGITL